MGRWFTNYVHCLNRSFAAVYSLLERPKTARRAVIALLAVHSALLAYSAYVHSPTLNEPGHLVAGLSYWKFGQFDAKGYKCAACEKSFSAYYKKGSLSHTVPKSK